MLKHITSKNIIVSSCENFINLCLVVYIFVLHLVFQNTLELVDCGAGGPIRCNRCKAYMSPYARFIDGGRKYMCPVCQCSNEGQLLCIQFQCEICY